MLDDPRLETAGFLLILGFFVWGFATGGGSTGQSINETEAEHEIHELVNERRQQHDLSNLSYDEDLAEVAKYHSKDMAEEGYFAHQGPGIGGVKGRYDKFGLECRTLGENIFKINDSYYEMSKVPREGVNSWMNSTGHREAILTGSFDRHGIGVYRGEDAIYVTQNFCG
jgi:uncharacterized protein YkwD